MCGLMSCHENKCMFLHSLSQSHHKGTKTTTTIHHSDKLGFHAFMNHVITKKYCPLCLLISSFDGTAKFQTCNITLIAESNNFSLFWKLVQWLFCMIFCIISGFIAMSKITWGCVLVCSPKVFWHRISMFAYTFSKYLLNTSAHPQLWPRCQTVWLESHWRGAL